MLIHHHHPIIAIATAPGRGAVGIVRVSGKNLTPLATALFHRPLSPRQATYLALHDSTSQVIDKGLAIFFPAPHSFTGEDVLEFQGHGGPVVLQMVVARCLAAAAGFAGHIDHRALAELRLAQPGEFSERAFLNDKMDLAQAEAIADLIDASTESAARSAARSMSGEFSSTVTALLEQLIALRMLVEATLDFPEEDIDFLQKADAIGQIRRLQTAVTQVRQSAAQGAILREGIKVVIAGQPNAGKSSLLNALAGADVAIVTPIAGTTRDKVSQLIQIDGVPLHVVDTAGLRETTDAVESIGVARAWQEIESADAVLFLHDSTTLLDAESQDAINYRAKDEDIKRALSQSLPKATPVIHVWNKVDLWPEPNLRNDREQPAGLFVSATSGAGLTALRRQLLETVGWQALPEGVFMARERHVHALRSVGLQLDKAAAQMAATSPALDLLAEDLRQAQLHLSEITGAFSSDDLLGEIFSRFCIGK